MICTRLLILFASCLSCQAENDLELAAIGGFIEKMKRPTSVIANLCWPTNRLLNLATVMSQNNVMMSLNANSGLEKQVDYKNILFLVDLRCADYKRYIKECEAKDYLNYPFRWLLLSNKIGNIISDVLNDLDIRINSEIIIVERIENGYLGQYVHKINKQSPLRFHFFGIWSEKATMTTQHKIVSPRQKQFEGTKIRISIVVSDENSKHHLDDGIDDYIDTLTKTNYRLINHLMDYVNATREIFFTNSWGYRKNGTWNGMTGDMANNITDLGGTPMFITSERMSYISYLSCGTTTRLKFVFQQPKLSSESNLFLLSFSANLWYSLIVLVVIMFLAQLSVTMWEMRKITDNQDHIRIGDIVVLVIGAVCQQGTPLALKGGLSRAVMLILFLALMFVYTSYSANIVAILQSSSTKIKSLEDLLNSRLKLAAHDTVYHKHYLKTATEPVRKAIYLKIGPPGSPNSRFISMEEGIKNLQKGLFAFHMELGVGYKFVEKYFKESEKCDLQEIQFLQMLDPYLAVSKNSPYKEAFEIGLRKIQEHGIQIRENRAYYSQKPKCSGSVGKFVSVGLVDCYPALLVLTYGVVIAVCILFAEILVKRRELFLHRTRYST